MDQAISFGALADRLIADAPFDLTATSTSGLAVVFTSANDKIIINGNKATLAKAGRATIAATQPGNANYNAAVSINRSFCIKPAKPTITVGNATNEFVLTANAAAGNQWYRNGIVIPGATNAAYTTTQPGAYQVQVKIDDCASVFSDEQVLVVTGDIDSSSDAIVEVYPVPAKDWLSVSFSEEAGKKQLTTFDLMGRAITREEASGKEARIDLATYADGVYYLRVVAGNKTTRIRFVVQ